MEGSAPPRTLVGTPPDVPPDRPPACTPRRSLVFPGGVPGRARNGRGGGGCLETASDFGNSENKKAPARQSTLGGLAMGCVYGLHGVCAASGGRGLDAAGGKGRSARPVAPPRCPCASRGRRCHRIATGWHRKRELFSVAQSGGSGNMACARSTRCSGALLGAPSAMCGEPPR